MPDSNGSTATVEKSEEFVLTLSADDLTIDEVVEVEERVRQSVDSMLEDGTPKGKLIKALIWLQLRHEQPDADAEALWAQAGKVKLSNIKRGEPVSPTDASV